MYFSKRNFIILTSFLFIPLFAIANERFDFYKEVDLELFANLQQNTIASDTCDYDYTEDTWMFNSTELLLGQIYSRDNHFFTVFSPPGTERVVVKFDEYGKVVQNKAVVNNLFFTTPIPFINGQFMGYGGEAPGQHYLINWTEDLDISMIRWIPSDFGIVNLRPIWLDECTDTSVIMYHIFDWSELRFTEIGQSNRDSFLITKNVSMLDSTSFWMFTAPSGNCDEVGVLSNNDKIFAFGATEYYQADTIQTLHLVKAKTNGEVIQKRFICETGSSIISLFPFAKDIDVDSNDNVYVLYEQDRKEYLFKLDADLNFIWGKEMFGWEFGSTPPNQFEEIEISSTDQIAMLGTAGVYSVTLLEPFAFPILLINTDGEIEQEIVFDNMTAYTVPSLNTLCSFQDSMWLFDGFNSTSGDILIKMDPTGYVDGCSMTDDVPHVLFRDAELILLDSSLLDVWYDTIALSFVEKETFSKPSVIRDFCDRLSSDLSINFLSANSCTFGVRAEMEICCLGEEFLPANLPFAVYDSNPADSTATLLYDFKLGQNVVPDSCILLAITMPYFDSDALHIIANDDQSVLPPFDLDMANYGIFREECDYSNNVDSAYFDPGIALDVSGEETLIFCDSFLTNLHAPPGYTYLWDTDEITSVIEVSEARVYIVAIFDECGNTQFYEFEVIQYPHATELYIEPETVYCDFDEDPVELIAYPSQFQIYNWSESNIPTNMNYIESTEGYYGVTVTDFCGNIDSTSIFIEPAVFDISHVEFEVHHPICQFDKGEVTVSYPGIDLGSRLFNLDGSLAEIENSATPPGLDTLDQVEPGTYLLGIRTPFGLNSCVFIHPDTVVINEPELLNFSLPENNSVVCFEDTILLSGPEDMLNYYWTGGYSIISCDTCQQTTYIPKESATIKLFVTELNGCLAESFTYLNVFKPDTVIINTVAASCAEASDGVIIIQTTDSVSYQLNNGSFQLDPTFFDVIGGNHELTLLGDYGCSYNYQTTISSPPPLVIENLDNFEINNGTIITIDPQISGGTAPYSYEWTGNQELECDFCETIDVAPIANSTYHLMVTDFNGCQVSTTYEVIVSNPQNIFIPNIFSPNNDGINDIHTVYANSDVEKVLSYQIFNKNGDLYFELKDFDPNSTSTGWDGKFDGIQLNPAIFICVVEVLFRNGDRKQIVESVAVVY